MKPSQAVLWLAGLVAVLALTAAVAGLLWPPTGAPYTFTSIHGDPVTIYGQGLYAADSVMKSGATRGTDLVVAVLGVPLLVISLIFYRRGSLRGALLLAGALTFFFMSMPQMPSAWRTTRCFCSMSPSSRSVSSPGSR